MTDNTQHWIRLLADTWGIAADLTPLPGEFDLNFLALTREGQRFVLKIMRTGCDTGFVDLLTAAHEHVRSRDATVPVARVTPTRDGKLWHACKDAGGESRLAWVLAGLDGKAYANVLPHSLALIAELGSQLARLDRTLADFAHPGLARDLKWDLRNAGWIGGRCHEINDPVRRAIVEKILDRYLALRPALMRQPVAPIHNDLNDYNVLADAGEDGRLRISGLIDFGDILVGPIVAELAIAGAYVVLDHPSPERALAALVAGYHAVSALDEAQVDLIWPLLLLRLAVSVTNSAMMQQARPDDAYVVVSEAPAWRFLEQAHALPETLIAARLRVACGLPPCDGAGRVRDWLDRARGGFAPVLGAPLADAPACSLAVADSATPRDPFRMTTGEARDLGHGVAPAAAWLGCYGEPRLIYTDMAFRLGQHRGSDRRTIHLGIDVFMPAGTPVCAPLDGVVAIVKHHDRPLDYGGMVTLAHTTPEGDHFHTLFGHLSRASVARLEPGQRIARGTAFAALGDPEENGGWAPHLHLQLATMTDGLGEDWPGVADPDDAAFWHAICPNPAALLNLPDVGVAYRPLDTQRIGAMRRNHFATNLRLSYDEPCLFVRGWRTHLFDEWGRPYLDAYNNVPHVGHSHPRLQAVACQQLLRLNSNTRYLHPAQIEFAESLLAKMPPHLTHVFFVNSGSEGNELALRLARAHSGGKDMIVADHGYHGNTTGAIDLSAYKFNRPRGGGPPPWVQIVPVADTYRGAHRGDDAAERYASAVDSALERIRERGGRLAGFIAETFPSVGGQVIPPAGYLPAVYARIRAAGGVCIADEVQTGLGRLGEFYWGFEQQAARPDIVVLGKPLGNGHPLGAVVTTAEIARSFDNGIEFFSTFGGSTLSCRIGTEVLRIVDDERLQQNARLTGERLLAGLRALQSSHEAIGDVRGIGLFIGVDLVADRATRVPATRLAGQVKNRLRAERILIGTEGPADNVLKIRPPLTIEPDDVDQLLETLDRVLNETQGTP